MLFGGIDWSDRFLDYHLRTADGRVLAQGQVESSVEGLAELFTALESQGPATEIGIAIETCHGAWIQPLLDRGYAIYPVNPKTVERFREALSAAGNKSDKIDRKVLAMFLVTFHQDCLPLRPDAPEIVSLRMACQDAFAWWRNALPNSTSSRPFSNATIRPSWGSLATSIAQLPCNSSSSFLCKNR